MALKGITMVELFLDGLNSKAKPAGSLGRFGNITQNKNGYSAWMAAAVLAIKKATEVRGARPYAIAFFMYPSNFKVGDILNIAGAVMDALVKAGVLRDDSPCNVSRVYSAMLRKPIGRAPYMYIYLCENLEELRDVHLRHNVAPTDVKV